MAGDNSGHVLVSSDPLGGKKTWKVVNIGHSLAGLSCPSVSLCVGVDFEQNVVTSTDPAGGAGSWNIADVDNSVGPECGKPDPGQNCVLGFVGVTCPSVSLCVAVDGENNVVTSTHPTGGPSAWKIASVHPDDAGEAYSLAAPTCPSVSLCLTVAEGGDIISSRNPAGGAAAWSTSPRTENLADASCPRTTLCVAGTDANGKGTGIVSYDPLGGPSAWKTTIDPAGGLAAASCPSRALCVTADNAGNILVGTPTPSSAALRRLLARDLAPHRTSVRSLLHPGSYRFPFKAPSAGRLTDTWYLRSATPVPHGHQATLLPIASVNTRFQTPGAYRLDFKLSKQTRHLVSTTTDRYDLVATGSFTAAEGSTVHSRETVRLFR